MKWIKRNYLLVLTHMGALIPMAILLWDWSQGNLTANPIQAVTLRTGRFAIILLLLSLAITPLNSVFGWRKIMPLRKWLGLYAALYAGIHFFIFIGIDYAFNLNLIKADLLSKKYILVGFSAGLILLPLVLTSTKGWMKRMKKNWKRLHRLVYMAGSLAVVHYIWLVKSDIRIPLLYGAILLVLLTLRIPAVRRRTSRLRNFRKWLPTRASSVSS